MSDSTSHKKTGKELTPEERRETVLDKPKKKRGKPFGLAHGAKAEVDGARIRLDKLRIMPSGVIVDTSAVEFEEREGQLVKKEWVFEGKGLAPQAYLIEVRGFSRDKADSIMRRTGGATGWYGERDKIKNSVTETLVKRHVDLVAETQESHITGAKLTMAKAMDMLANGPEHVDKSTGAKSRYSLRSIDLLNCATAIEKAQRIYRTAIGFGSDEGGLKQILEAIQRTGMTQINIQNNTTIEQKDIDLPPEELAMRDKMTKMSYEDLVEIIEWRREQKKKREEEAKKK